MSRMHIYLAALVLTSSMAFAPATLAAQQDKIDVTGKWLFTVTTDAGTGTPTVTLKQNGDTLTGHYSSQLLGEADLKGMVKEQKIVFSFKTEVQGTALTISYSGSIENKDSMKGTVDLGGVGTGTFTAKRL